MVIVYFSCRRVDIKQNNTGNQVREKCRNTCVYKHTNWWLLLNGDPNESSARSTIIRWRRRKQGKGSEESTFEGLLGTEEGTGAEERGTLYDERRAFDVARLEQW